MAKDGTIPADRLKTKLGIFLDLEEVTKIVGTLDMIELAKYL